MVMYISDPSFVSFLDIDLFEVFTNIGGNFHEFIVSWGGEGFKGLGLFF